MARAVRPHGPSPKDYASAAGAVIVAAEDVAVAADDRHVDGVVLDVGADRDVLRERLKVGDPVRRAVGAEGAVGRVGIRIATRAAVTAHRPRRGLTPAGPRSEVR